MAGNIDGKWKSSEKIEIADANVRGWLHSGTKW
jgi:hypothetical protein